MASPETKKSIKDAKIMKNENPSPAGTRFVPEPCRLSLADGAKITSDKNFSQFNDNYSQTIHIDEYGYPVVIYK